MRIVMVGCGYVGLVTGVCFAAMGNRVCCVDTDAAKIAQLQQGASPIYEPGLEALIRENAAKGQLYFSESLEKALPTAEMVFIAVGTPAREDGGADLQYVYAVAHQIGSLMQRSLIVVNKSTVPVGTADEVRQIIRSELTARKADIPFDVVSNPEFLKEGAAIKDFMSPDRIIVGGERAEAIEAMRMLYAPFTLLNDRFIAMDTRSAEMTKYAANAMLATKISFINEIANICDRVGADVQKVRIGIGSDKRIGYSFIYPGIGYGGSCFPKDVKALIHMAESNGHEPALLRSVETVNLAQKSFLVRKLLTQYGEDLSGKTFALWGLSFKPETDDMREAPSLVIIGELLRRGAAVRAYDPKAMGKARSRYLKEVAVTYCSGKYEALQGACALLLATEWKEFRAPDFEEIATLLEDKIIFDGRNQYDPEQLASYGLRCVQVGRPAWGAQGSLAQKDDLLGTE